MVTTPMPILQESFLSFFSLFALFQATTGFVLSPWQRQQRLSTAGFTAARTALFSSVTVEQIADQNSTESLEARNDDDDTPNFEALEDAVSDQLWIMRILQNDPEFLQIRPQQLQDLMKQCASSTAVQQSTIKEAGKGLFATRDIAAGSIFTFYPVHHMGVTFGDGRMWILRTNGDSDDDNYDDDDDPSSSRYIMTLLGNRPLWSGMDLEEEFGAMGFVDADPDRTTQPAWLCHYVNDGAIIQGKGRREDVMEYYQSSLQAQNALFVPIGPAPLVAAVATRSIQAGEEIFTCYGRSYWMGVVQPDRELWEEPNEVIRKVEQKIATAIEEAVEHTQNKYADEIFDLYEAFGDLA